MPMPPRTWILAVLLSALLTCLLAPAVRAEEPPAPEDAAAAGVAFEPGTPALADVLAKAKAQDKPAFLDFRTDT